MLVKQQQEANAKNSQQFVQNAAALLKFHSSHARIVLYTAASASRK
jgi:hypothetical protein